MAKNILILKSKGRIDTSGRTLISSSTGNPPNWILPGAIIDMDFANGRFWGMEPSNLTLTRTTAAYGTYNSGMIRSFPAGTPVVTDLGFQSWVAATNLLVQSEFAATWT